LVRSRVNCGSGTFSLIQGGDEAARKIRFSFKKWCAQTSKECTVRTLSVWIPVPSGMSGDPIRVPISLQEAAAAAAATVAPESHRQRACKSHQEQNSGSHLRRRRTRSILTLSSCSGLAQLSRNMVSISLKCRLKRKNLLLII